MCGKFVSLDSDDFWEEFDPWNQLDIEPRRTAFDIEDHMKMIAKKLSAKTGGIVVGEVHTSKHEKPTIHPIDATLSRIVGSGVNPLGKRSPLEQLVRIRERIAKSEGGEPVLEVDPDFTKITRLSLKLHVPILGYRHELFALEFLVDPFPLVLECRGLEYYEEIHEPIDLARTITEIVGSSQTNLTIKTLMNAARQSKAR